MVITTASEGKDVNSLGWRKKLRSSVEICYVCAQRPHQVSTDICIFDTYVLCVLSPLLIIAFWESFLYFVLKLSPVFWTPNSFLKKTIQFGLSARSKQKHPFISSETILKRHGLAQCSFVVVLQAFNNF